VILLCGIPSETPLRLVGERLRSKGAPVVWFSQRNAAAMQLEFHVREGKPEGELRIGGERHDLARFTAVYTRLMDDRHLPELRGEPEDSPRRKHCRALHDALLRWYEIAPARVVNRTAPMGSNFSKPYQAQRIAREGFRVPATLVTNDPAAARAFFDRHRKLIFKSISGVRSIVKTLDADDWKRIDDIRACPVQFQEFVEGRNVRVHVIGDKTFATAISSEATDYRYAGRQTGEAARLEEVELQEETAAMCVRLAHALELPFAGIDLKVTPEEEVYCFEVNPSPAYSYYESQTGQPISQALADYLMGE
jgi:glutathione synthase/RimK-type ligase-like ATP-grasp enzyme